MTFPLLYEINTRCWLRELSDKCGQAVTLADVPEQEFAAWRRLGFTHIWLMGAWTVGPRAREQALSNPGQRLEYAEALPDLRDEDVAASPYAIADYHVPAALGGDEGLNKFRARLRAHGLKLVLDFVPNHLGLDHSWIKEYPSYFVQRPDQAPETFPVQTPGGLRWLAHGKDPNFGAWTDTAQLDYRRQETREAMVLLLQSVAQRCDGVRCDMAMLVLNDVFARTWKAFSGDTANLVSAIPARNAPARLAGPEREAPSEFWETAIRLIKLAHPHFMFLAEAYWGLEQRLQELGFDYTYDKQLYDRLIARDGADVQRLLLERSQKLARYAHFLENHDERRISALLDPTPHGAAALVVLGLPGLRLLHEGQITGARVRAPVQLTRRRLEPALPQIHEMYERILTTLPATAVGQGRGDLLSPRPAWPGNQTAQNFVLIQWQKTPPEFDLVVVNLSSHRGQCYAPLTVGGLAAHNWTMKDLLGNEQYVRWGDDLQKQGLYLDVPPQGAQLFHFQPTG